MKKDRHAMSFSKYFLKFKRFWLLKISQDKDVISDELVNLLKERFVSEFQACVPFACAIPQGAPDQGKVAIVTGCSDTKGQ